MRKEKRKVNELDEETHEGLPFWTTLISFIAPFSFPFFFFFK